MIAGNDYNNLIDLSNTSLTQIDYITTGLGNDNVTGSIGNDVIIGGAGSDNLKGGAGDDIFLIEGTDSGYDTFNGGQGHDSVVGGDNDDTIRLHNFSGENTVEEINGGAGLNVIAGNDYNNLIDLSNTTLTQIDYITTGLGNDNVTGSIGNDVIIGGAGSDNLKGGAGDDSFLFNKLDGKDTISDTTGNDSILFGNEVSASDIAIFMNGADLIINYGEGDNLTIKEQGTTNTIERFELSDGHHLTGTNINQIALALSTFAANEGITLNGVADVLENDQLMDIITSEWQM